MLFENVTWIFEGIAEGLEVIVNQILMLELFLKKVRSRKSNNVVVIIDR